MPAKNSSCLQIHPVILVIGQAGVGKSSFINTALGKPLADVGDSYDDGTKNAKAFLCEGGEPEVYLVDTPGLDDTYQDDKAILERILSYLEANVCKNDDVPCSPFGGILYLVAAGQHRLPMHDKLKSSPLLKDRLVVVGTKSSESAKYRTDVHCKVSDRASSEEAREAIKAAVAKARTGKNVGLKILIQELRKELGTVKEKKKKGNRNRRGLFSFLFFRFS